jgi:two-component system response regulator (stage 0 sporulation protein A)
MIYHKIKTVIIDDNDDFLDILEAYMSLSNDIEIIGRASAGNAALAVIAETEPDVVILDIIMPEQSGLDILKRINSGWGEKKPIFIMLTAVDSDQIAKEALSSGAERIMIKPIDMNMLVNTIRELYFKKAHNSGILVG